MILPRAALPWLLVPLGALPVACATGDNSRAPIDPIALAGGASSPAAGAAGAAAGAGGAAAGGSAGAAAGAGAGASAGAAAGAGAGGAVAGGAGAGGGACACDAGSTCVKGACTKVCQATADCPDGQSCSLVVDGPTPGTTFKVCEAISNECDPVKQTGCKQGEGCYPQTAGYKCDLVGAIAEGQPCEFASDCVGGASCFKVASQKTCFRLCDPADQGTCSGGVPCSKVDSTYGICN